METKGMTCHPHLADFPLISSPWPSLMLTVAYLVLSVIVGPWMMADRKPLKLRSAMLGYNLVQVMTNAYILYRFLANGFVLRHRLICQEMEDGPVGLDLAHLGYMYFVNKLMDLADTFFIVANKKFQQLSMLHLFHHASMIMVAWSTSCFGPGGQATQYPTVNSLIHILMYTYYLLAGLDFKWILKFKRYLTLLQMAQLLYALIISALALSDADCAFPRVPVVAAFAAGSSYFVLFVAFYRKEYRGRDGGSRKQKTEKGE